MAFTFDSTLKDLARDGSRAMVEMFDGPTNQPVSWLNVDLASVSTAADAVIGLGKPVTEILHFEFQSSASATKHQDVLAYNVLLHRHYSVPVHSIVILLRPIASHSNLSGRHHYASHSNRGKMEFEYELVRLWDVPAESILQSNVDLVPLAILGQLPKGDPDQALAGVVHRLVERIVKDSSADRSKKLLTSAFLLSGLVINPTQAKQLFQEAPFMHESSTFQAILEEGEERGRLEEARVTVKRLGEKRFGPPDSKIIEDLDSIQDLEKLRALIERIFDINSWDELLTQADSTQ